MLSAVLKTRVNYKYIKNACYAKSLDWYALIHVLQGQKTMQLDIYFSCVSLDVKHRLLIIFTYVGKMKNCLLLPIRTNVGQLV